jgi:hypothetical protein
VQLAPRQLDFFRLGRPATPATPSPASTPTEVAAPATAAEPVAAPQPPAAPRRREETVAQARALAARIAEHLGSDFKVLLTVHDNRSTMISFRRQPPLLKLRLHHMFLEAPAPIVQALADYAGRGRGAAGTLLDDYIAERQTQIRNQPRTASELVARGRCFDLQDVFDRVNQLYFQDGIRARIGWGRATGKRRRKSIRLGVYDHKLREIRLHPALDAPMVPLYFVEFIVFHEMLHQLFPSDRHAGRHVHHPRAFRDREKAFPKYALALAWEKENLHALLKR